MSYSAMYDALTRKIAAEQFPGDTRTAYVFYAMIRQECGFDADIVEGRRDSPAGARGIAQLMPVHWGAVDPLDPPAALRYAARFLRDLLARYGNPRAAVAAYNWGPANVDTVFARRGAAWESAPELPAETRRYLSAVFADAQEVDAAPFSRDSATGWLLPAAGPVTQPFGPTDEALDGPATWGGVTYPHFNTGIDIGCAPGTEVYAVRGGTVIWSGWRNRRGEPVDDGTGWGIAVWVQEEDGVVHNYGHLSAAAVSVGDVVERGALLGRGGNTGASTGPHLSYDVFRLAGGEPLPIDPAPYLAAGTPAAPAVTATVIPADGLRLRAGPGEDAAVIAVAPTGARVTLTRAAWYPVRWDGREGWMWGEYLSLDGPTANCPGIAGAAVALIRRIIAWADEGNRETLAALEQQVAAVLKDA